jgi:site-specific DNA-methyltransferase (adenine-specific)
LLINGDSLNELAKLDDNSVDLVVTDPPYGYSFMGKEWDKALPDKRIWKECLRVLKAGGFAYVMSAPRQDVLARMMVDLENVGFKMDFTSMYWAYATGFPKAMNMSKAIDKKLGVKSEVVGVVKHADNLEEAIKNKVGFLADQANQNNKRMMGYGDQELTKATSKEAKKLDGSYAGFQPKPAVEVIIVCMKPLEEKGYTDQALANGKGVSWFDDCRIPTGDSDKYDLEQRAVSKAYGIQEDDSFLDKIHDADAKHGVQDKGRYPANLLVSDNAVDTGKITKSPHNDGVRQFSDTVFNLGLTTGIKHEIGDSGDFSRYFDIDKWWESQFIITPKASKSEKNKGLDDFEDKKGKGQWNIEDNGNATAGMGNHNPLCLKCNCYKIGKLKSKPSCICDNPEWRTPKNLSTKNNHPTVKPLKLMSYLITLGSREGDTVLDPFMGSGTTPLASKQMGRKYIGIERDEDYFKICCARVGDEPTILSKEEENDFSQNPERQVGRELTIEEKPIEEKIVEENTICEVCGVDYRGSTKEEHEARQFHQDRLN